MKKYLINNLNESEFNFIITLLDYEMGLCDELNSIVFPSNKKFKVLVDGLLYSGLNENRFFELHTDEKGKLDIDNYKYVKVNKMILDKANTIVKDNPMYLENSILPRCSVRD